jgi:hypothetical protein
MFPAIDALFISIFGVILTTIAAVLIVSLMRARHDLSTGRADPIRWSQDFAEFPASDRWCRHALTGEAPSRVCPNAFDCRHCTNHPKFRQASRGEGPDMLFGLKYPNHRYYHRGHTWVAPQPDGTLLIGLDAIAEHMIGHPDIVKIPGAGSRVSNNGEAWRMWKDGLEVRVLCPVDGLVLQTGGPEDDWYLRIHPESKPADLRHLLRGDEVHPWVRRELERLQLAIARHGEIPALADGGVLVDEFIRELPEGLRDQVLGKVFLDA